MTKFGTCGLTLRYPRDAVATPSGRVYGKEELIEYMLTKKKELKRLRAAYVEHERDEKAKEEEEKRAAKETEIEQFKKANKRFVSTDGEKDDEMFLLAKRNRDIKDVQEEIVKKARVDDASKEEKIEQLRHSCPWTTQFTPSADAKKVKEPPKRPGSPVTGAPLRLNDLAPINFEFEEGSDSKENRAILCSVSKKVILHQPVVLIKPSKIVVLESVFQEIIKPTMRCPLTNVKLSKSDILPLINETTE